MELDLKSRKTEWLSDEEILLFFEPYNNMDKISIIENTYTSDHKSFQFIVLAKYWYISRLNLCVLKYSITTYLIS